MTTFVLVSDIHGNAPALRKVIEREGGGANYIFLGDIHGLLGYPKETLALVQKHGVYVLAGNHDKAIFHHGEGHVNSEVLSRFERDYTLSNLSESDIRYMKNLSFMHVMKNGPVKTIMTHAKPWPEEASGYESGNEGIRKRDIPAMASKLADRYDYVFHGHTHVQYSLDCSKFGHDITFVNPGSLGYSGTYAVVDDATGEVELKSVDVDMGELCQHIDSILPDDCPAVWSWL